MLLFIFIFFSAIQVVTLTELTSSRSLPLCSPHQNYRNVLCRGGPSVPKLGSETHSRDSTTILDRGNYSRGSPEQ